MKIIGNIITGFAAFAFMLSISMLDSDPVFGMFVLYVSGIVLAIRCYLYEQKRLREGKH